jgi:hypothetical protein
MTKSALLLTIEALKAQATHGGAADAFPTGDVKTARMFGTHFAETLQQVGGLQTDVHSEVVT